MRIRELVVLGVLAVVMACERQPVTTGQAPAPEVAPPAPSPTEPAPAVPAPAEPANEAQARALLQTWLDAQNQGDFAAYAQLYAREMLGVKRSGDRVQRFDHDGWLKDRKPSFKAPMTVRIENLRLSVFGGRVHVSFEQFWRSATYADSGNKLLVLVPEDGQLRIGNETMLSSHVAVPAGEALLPPEIGLVQAIGKRHYLVLSDGADAADAVGRGVLAHHDSFSAVVMRKPAPARVSDQARAIAGRRFVVHSRDGRVCTASASKLQLVQEVIGTDVDAFFEPSVESPIDNIWDAGSQTLLVAQLDVLEGDCKGALWARAEDLPAPTLFTRVDPVEPDLHALGTTKLRRLPSYVSGKRALAEEDLGGVRHWELAGELRTVQWSGAARRYLSIEAHYGIGCGDATAAAWAVIEASSEANGAAAVLSNPRDAEPFAAIAVIDIDSDGLVEVIGRHGRNGDLQLLRMIGGRLKPVLVIRPSFVGCHC